MSGAHWMLLIGLAFAGVAAHDLIRGRTLLARRDYSREKNPLAYWAGIAFLLLMTLLLLAGAADLWRSGCGGFVSRC